MILNITADGEEVGSKCACMMMALEDTNYDGHE